MTHDQKKSEEKGKALQDEREELKQKARDVQERKRAQFRRPDDPGGDQVPRPNPDDPRHGQPHTQADETNVPTGQTTGGAMGRSAKRKKDHAG